MSITLKRLLLECERNYNMKLIAGEKGLDNMVRWVHTVEDDEVSSFLHGNELVFTTGIGIASKPNFDFVSMARMLVNKNAAGWVLNLGPYIKDVSDVLKLFCNVSGLPLFVIPWQERIIDITYDFTHLIIENEDREQSIEKSFSSIIDTKQVSVDAKNILERSGFDDSSSYSIIKMDLNSNSFNKEDLKIVSKTLVLEVEGNHDYCVIVNNLSIIIVAKDFTTEEIERSIEYLKTKFTIKSLNLYVRIGVSSKKKGLGNVYKLYDEALASINVGNIQDKEVIYYDDIGIYQILESINDTHVLLNYVDSKLKNIIDYDKENNTDYLDVLRLYIYTNRSVNEVANKLNCHRNTINYKVKFIKDTFGFTYEVEEVSQLWLAFKILDSNIK